MSKKKVRIGFDKHDLAKIYAVLVKGKVIDTTWDTETSYDYAVEFKKKKKKTVKKKRIGFNHKPAAKIYAELFDGEIIDVSQDSTKSYDYVVEFTPKKKNAKKENPIQ